MTLPTLPTPAISVVAELLVTGV